MADEIKIEILEDGVISVTTDGISNTNHLSADELIDGICELAGGKRDTTHREHHHHDKVKAHSHKEAKSGA